MSKRCVFEDDGNRCLHEDRRRTGDLAGVFGEHPFCTLMIVPACALQDAGRESGQSDTIWAKIAEKK